MEKEAFEKKYFTLFIPHAIEVVIGAGTWHCFPKKKKKLQSNNIRFVAAIYLGFIFDLGLYSYNRKR
jgi:hypothetical protein